jgi:hypothetical protein
MEKIHLPVKIPRKFKKRIKNLGLIPIPPSASLLNTSHAIPDFMGIEDF